MKSESKRLIQVRQGRANSQFKLLDCIIADSKGMIGIVRVWLYLLNVYASRRIPC